MPRGAKPGQRLGGRVKGTPNKATADVRALAQQYTAQVIEELARILIEGESEQARIAAGKELLDRGHGKPTQPVAGEIDAKLVVEIVRYADDPPAE